MTDVSRTPNLSPTFLEMALRMRSKARSIRYTASKETNISEKQALLDDAERYDRIAASMIEDQIEVLHARDGMIAEYRKSVANRGVAL